MNKKQFWIIIAVLILALSISVGMIACGDAKEELESIYKPTNIRYDGTVLTWDEVTLAEYYYVQIDGGERKRTNTNSFVYPDIDKEFEVVVTSVYKEREEEKHIGAHGTDRFFGFVFSVMGNTDGGRLA